MKIQNEFSKHATTYGTFNIIQTKVIAELINRISDQPGSILDIGCGSGGLYKSISWPLKRFVGFDFAQKMIDLHPKNQHIELYVKDFNQPSCFKDFNAFTFDRIVSASALQWADDLDKTLHDIAALNAPVSLAIFTSGTFKTLYQTASISPLIRSADEVLELSKKYFNAAYQIQKYTLEFSSVRDMFRYMKKSGVSGSRNLLNYRQMKTLMHHYPLNYLEFEILMIDEKDFQRK